MYKLAKDSSFLDLFQTFLIADAEYKYIYRKTNGDIYKIDAALGFNKDSENNLLINAFCINFNRKYNIRITVLNNFKLNIRKYFPKTNKIILYCTEEEKKYYLNNGIKEEEIQIETEVSKKRESRLNSLFLFNFNVNRKESMP